MVNSEVSGQLPQIGPPGALAHDEQVRPGDLLQHARPGLEQRWMPLLGLETGDDANDLRARLHAVLVPQRAARLLVLVALQVDAVVDEADRSQGPSLLDDLLLHRARHGDELVHVRREPAQLLAILRGTNP
jgi:hypothetical protein